LKRTIVLVLCVFLSTRLCAQEIPNGPSTDAAFLAKISGLFILEDPTSIYNFSIRDKEVEFILDGSWAMDLSSAMHISFSKDLSSYTFIPPVFAQTVNLSSWIFLDKTWYFESSFAEEFTRNTVAAGYVGNDDTVIKHVRLGNSGILFPENYPFVRVGGGTAIAPGIMGTFAGKTWNADAVVRYDTAVMRQLVLSGMNEVTDTLIPVTSPVRGKWFILPDAPITGTVSVFLEDDTGTHHDSKGRNWRELSASEFRISGISGIVELEAATSASVAVIYSGSYAISPTQAGTSLVDFVKNTRDYFVSATGNVIIDDYLKNANAYIGSIDGQNALIVRERGFFSPFEALFRYSATGSDLDSVYTDSGMNPSWLTVDSYSESYAEILLSNAADNGFDYIRTPEARFPLERAFPLLYFPGFGGKKIQTDLAVRSRSYTPISTIALGDEVIAGTIQVTRNGVTDTAFTFDDAAGSLTLAKPPQSGETIKISWLNTDQSTRNATLTLALGIRWKPVPSLELSGASAFRWNTSKDGFTDSGENSPGSYIVSSGISWTGARVSASTSFDFDITVPDTTGFYRILGMDSGTRTINPAEDWYKPISSSISPVLGKPYADKSTAPPVILDKAARIDLEGTNGKSISSIIDSAVSGSVLSLSCSLPSKSNWAGADILAGTSGMIDFSSAQTVTITLRNPGTTNEFAVYLQLGNYDSDSFEDSATVRTWLLPTPVAGGGWRTASIHLSDDDRRALTAGKEMRLIVMPSSTSTPSAVNPLKITLFSGPFEIIDSDFGTSSGLINLEETSNPSGVADAAGSSYGSVLARFTSGANNTVLKAGFTPISGLEIYDLNKSIAAIPLSSYNRFSFFIFAPLVPDFSSGSAIRIILGNPSPDGSGTDNACEFEIAASAITPGEWHRISVNLLNKTIQRDGSSLTGSEARIIKLDRSLSPTHVDISFEKWPIRTIASSSEEMSWTVYIDELFLEESNPEYTGRNETDFSWKKNGPLLSAGKIALVSDTSLSVRTTSSITAGSKDPVVGGSLKGGISLLAAQLSGSISASSGAEKYLETTAHSILIPIGPISAKEGYSIDLIENTLTREDSLAFAEILGGTLSVSERHSGIKMERKTGLSVFPKIPETSIGNFSLSADSRFSQSGITPLDPVNKTPWGGLWTKSFPLLFSPGESNANSRNVLTEIKTGWTLRKPEDAERSFGLSGLALDTSLQSKYASRTETDYGSIISFTLSSPITILDMTLTPEWNRSVEQNKITQAGGSYYADSKLLSSSFSQQRWLFSIPPIADLFNADLKDTIHDNGTWSRIFTNKYSLGWKRVSTGVLSDLYIPSTINASIQRATETDASSENFRDGWTAPVKAGFQALNIAGSFGVLHLFPWYEQDEIGQLYGWTPHWDSHSFLWSADTWHSITLFFPNGGTIVAENIYHYDSPDIAKKNELTKDTVRLIWKRKAAESFIDIPLRMITKLALTTRREDSASVALTIREKNTSNIAYDHLLATGIGKNGELRLSAGTGFTISQAKLESIDFRLGIGGKITY